jgi:hypothetical protein
MSIPTKTTSSCSNVYLIDETLCLSNSLGVINYNVASLSSALISLENYQVRWNSLYSNFTTYSAVWIKTVTNVQNFSSNWVSFSNTVQNLSGDWQKPYTFFYPQMLEIYEWYNKTTNQQNNFISNWLNLNFPAIYYNKNQIINVTIYLYQIQPINFSFIRTFDETCIPNCPGISVSCDSGSCPPLYQGCNHHGGLAGVKGCDNLFSYCSQQAYFSGPQSVSCTGEGGRQLRVSLNNPTTDTHVSQTITISFINTNNNWVPTQ